MVALASLTTDERADMQAELELTRIVRAGYKVRLRREELAGRETAKLVLQVNACDLHIARFERELAA